MVLMFEPDIILSALFHFHERPVLDRIKHIIKDGYRFNLTSTCYEYIAQKYLVCKEIDGRGFNAKFSPEYMHHKGTSNAHAFARRVEFAEHIKDVQHIECHTKRRSPLFTRDRQYIEPVNNKPLQLYSIHTPRSEPITLRYHDLLEMIEQSGYLLTNSSFFGPLYEAIQQVNRIADVAPINSEVSCAIKLVFHHLPLGGLRVELQATPETPPGTNRRILYVPPKANAEDVRG
jgi:hypothetical protein